MAIAQVTDSEIVTALRAVREHGSGRKAAAALGVNQTTIINYQRQAAQRGLTADTPVRDPLAKSKEEVRLLKKQLSEIQKHNDTAEEIRKTIFNLKNLPFEPPSWLVAKSVKIEGPGTPCMLWSDWHFGEVVQKKEVGGLNEFNSDIAEQRATELVDRFLALVKHHMPKGVPGAVICLGGDMMTGEIHQELAETNDRYIQETVRQLRQVLANALTRVADACGKVYVPCVVGNHGRMTMKPRMKGRVQTSYEWGIYQALEDFMRADKRIKFDIPDNTDAHFSVHGWKFMLTHGDSLGVKGGDGIIGALGPIKRGEFKTRNSEGQIGHDFDWLLMGHWHQYISTRGLIVNNCLKGYDEFARIALRAPATPASQALWFVHPKNGVNTQMEVYVQDPTPFRARPSETTAWVEVFGGKP